MSQPIVFMACVLTGITSVGADESPLLTKDQIVASLPAAVDQPAMELFEAWTIGTWNEAPLPPWFLTFHRTPWRSDSYVSSVALYRRDAEGYRLVKRWTPRNDDGVGPYITRPHAFQYEHEQFLHIPMRYAGTGAFREDVLVHLGRNGIVTPVEFEPASKGYARLVGEGKATMNSGEGVWKGEHYVFTDDALRFVFYIWNKGDGNCCPTAGCVEGTMRIGTIDGDTRRFLMSIDTFVRRPIDERDR